MMGFPISLEIYKYTLKSDESDSLLTPQSNMLCVRIKWIQYVERGRQINKFTGIANTSAVIEYHPFNTCVLYVRTMMRQITMVTKYFCHMSVFTLLLCAVYFVITHLVCIESHHQCYLELVCMFEYMIYRIRLKNCEITMRNETNLQTKQIYLQHNEHCSNDARLCAVWCK